jgi:enoyl-CoA hydratase/carnithine racemase
VPSTDTQPTPPVTAATDSPAVLIERIDVSHGAHLGLITLNRPDQMNAVDWETCREIARAIGELEGDDSVRVIAVTGSGRAFSAGGDMDRYRDLQRDAENFPIFLREAQEMVIRMHRSAKPCLALVNGLAIAGGFELILACDVVFAARSARLGDAHLNFGQVGGGGVLTMLTRTVGLNRARELILSGRLLEAEEAREWGLVNRVVDGAELLDAAIEFTKGVAAKSALGVAHAKRILNTSMWNGTGMEMGFELELETVLRYCLTSHDAPEGLEAFAAKRRPNFLGK